MTTIYGLHEVGSDEIRYVGRTDKALNLRLTKHIQNAARNYPPRISSWINTVGAVRIVSLAECLPGCAVEAERRMVEQLCADGHRLTNSHLVPRARQSGAAA